MYCDKHFIVVSFDDNIFFGKSKFFINPQDKENNRVIFTLRENYKIPEHLKTIKDLFEIFSLEEDGLVLITRKLKSYEKWVKDGRYSEFTPTANYIKLIPPVNIRTSFDSLTEKGFFSSDDRYNLESHLRKIEKSIEFSSVISSEISLAQKDIILGMIEPYIEDLKKEVDDNEDLCKYIVKLGSSARMIADPLTISLTKTLFWTWQYKDVRRKSDDFFECLLSVIKIYNGTSNLETALLQNGPSLPSKETIMSIIKERLNFS